MNHANMATVHEIKIRRVAYFYSAAERRSCGELWPSFAPALIGIRNSELLFHQWIRLRSLQFRARCSQTGSNSSQAPSGSFDRISVC
jgi:hypothetical protein